MGGAAKIVSFLDKTNGAGLHYIQDCRTPQPCCKEKWRIQYGRKAKSEYIFTLSNTDHQ